MTPDKRLRRGGCDSGRPGKESAGSDMSSLQSLDTASGGERGGIRHQPGRQENGNGRYSDLGRPRRMGCGLEASLEEGDDVPPGVGRIGGPVALLVGRIFEGM